MDKNCSHLHSKFHYVSIKMGTAMVDIQNAYHSKFHYVSIKIGTMMNLCVLMFSLNSTMFLLRYKPPWLKKNVLSCSKFHYVSIKMIQISDRIMFLAFSKFHYVSIKMEQQRKTAIKRSALNSTMFLLR